MAATLLAALDDPGEYPALGSASRKLAATAPRLRSVSADWKGSPGGDGQARRSRSRYPTPADRSARPSRLPIAVAGSQWSGGAAVLPVELGSARSPLLPQDGQPPQRARTLSGRKIRHDLAGHAQIRRQRFLRGVGDVAGADGFDEVGGVEGGTPAG
ncbi:hypothetical protein HD597_005291 [Nonomuraea thailandensis]|uniref:Uncharacterized protein n=1 Tax=Nonomuraea thailandensis TaxID=1188745 RepID=A0A9X2K628_9ACTN|nr:hypothetical protein [Nonomuraea thailandensis]MCP2358271.1 hypothetical protein [Nonomuraea thailandensis]